MRVIQLKSNGLGRYDDVSPFIITDGKLEIKVVTPKSNGLYFFVAENNTTKFKTLIPEDGIVTLNGLTAGELKSEVKHYLKGELIETFKIEHLLLKDLDCNLSGTPEIVALQKEIEELKTAVMVLKSQLQNLYALIRFAYKDYQDNVYLSGGTFKDFVNEFGFALTDEEIKLIIGENEND